MDNILSFIVKFRKDTFKQTMIKPHYIHNRNRNNYKFTVTKL